ncbi:uncharacterized protein LOC119309296 isoform X2 [Triticum dicoccoides]|uniref:uncharacterized protein LOC119309296 isoform X2 n=1 Tax=Triticum dicoccoides TaxID=85692 RepID=UPI001890372B|nr:uncharacterized protein LOC119309296 isoform X2 [Triticum dicoccoides]
MTSAATSPNICLPPPPMASCAGGGATVSQPSFWEHHRLDLRSHATRRPSRSHRRLDVRNPSRADDPSPQHAWSSWCGRLHRVQPQFRDWEREESGGGTSGGCRSSDSLPAGSGIAGVLRSVAGWVWAGGGAPIRRRVAAWCRGSQIHRRRLVVKGVLVVGAVRRHAAECPMSCFSPTKSTLLPLSSRVRGSALHRAPQDTKL